MTNHPYPAQGDKVTVEMPPYDLSVRNFTPALPAKCQADFNRRGHIMRQACETICEKCKVIRRCAGDGHLPEPKHKQRQG